MGYEGHQCMILGYLYFSLNLLLKPQLNLIIQSHNECCPPAPSHPNLRQHKGKKHA